MQYVCLDVIACIVRRTWLTMFCAFQSPCVEVFLSGTIIYTSTGSFGLKKKQPNKHTPTLTEVLVKRGQTGLLRDLPSYPTKRLPLSLHNRQYG